MWIRRNNSKSRGSDETYGFNIRLSKVDIKKPLQQWLHLELENNVYQLHSEEEIRDYLRQNVFSYFQIGLSMKFWNGLSESDSEKAISVVAVMIKRHPYRCTTFRWLYLT